MAKHRSTVRDNYVIVSRRHRSLARKKYERFGGSRPLKSGPGVNVGYAFVALANLRYINALNNNNNNNNNNFVHATNAANHYGLRRHVFEVRRCGRLSHYCVHWLSHLTPAVACTGSSAVCPASVNVSDKTRCDEDSVCHYGVSVGSCRLIATFASAIRYSPSS